MNQELIIRSRRVVTDSGISPATIHISDGRIEAISEWIDADFGSEFMDAGESVVMAGLVDSHVHINEPGRTEWEGFETATKAAAAGGVTTLIDMPLNSIPPTTTISNLEAKRRSAEGKCYVDVGFWAGVIPGNLEDVEPLVDAGVAGFKCFLLPSGVPEFPHVTYSELREFLPGIARLGSILIAHAESHNIIEHACAAVLESGNDPREYKTFLKSRPGTAEDEAVRNLIELSRDFKARVHIVHHSSASSLQDIRSAKDAGVPITAETCPHYLCFEAEQIPDGATWFKCCPPIREHSNRELLWNALEDGTLDMVVSDHSPCPPEMKELESGNFLTAWGGISSLQFRLGAVWTESRRRGHDLVRLAEWLCSAPARLAGVGDLKGKIAPGFDADLVIFDPDSETTAAPTANMHRHKVSPYNGMKLYGRVDKTFLRGKLIFDGREVNPVIRGRLIDIHRPMPAHNLQ